MWVSERRMIIKEEKLRGRKNMGGKKREKNGTEKKQRGKKNKKLIYK